MRNLIREFMRSGIAATLALMFALSLGAFAANNDGNHPAFVTGELMISVPHGTTADAVKSIANTVSADVVYSFGSVDPNGAVDAYHLRIRGSVTADQTTAAAVTLKAAARIRYAGVNRLSYPTAVAGVTEPNDPRYLEQWHLKMINMPQAWTLEKGKPDVVIAVVDTGVDIDHPEFPASRVLTGYNSVTLTSNPRPAAGQDHGTHVAGIAMAQANNGIGVSGVVWDNVKLLPVNAAGATGAFADDSLLRAYQFVGTTKSSMAGSRFVLNLSLGYNPPSDIPDLTNLPPSDLALLALAKSGVVVCCAAGNDYAVSATGVITNPPGSPAYFSQISDYIISVGAVGPTGLHSSYSNARPYTTIAAPGGDAALGAGNSNLILSTLPIASGSYGVMQGTSMATPVVSGVCALVLSIPGVTPDTVKSILTSTAVKVKGQTLPTDPMYGYGIVDCFAALSKVSVGIRILEPSDTTETLRPKVRIQVSRIDLANVTVKIDGVTVPFKATNEQNIFPVPNAITGVVATQFDLVLNDPSNPDPAVDRDFIPGSHIILATGIKTTTGSTITTTLSDTLTFNVVPHRIPAGKAFISIPYFESGVIPETYFGSSFTLGRYIDNIAQYAFYSPGGTRNPRASFQPPDILTHSDGATISKTPIGIAYWSLTASSTPILTRGVALTDRSFIIPLKPADQANPIHWNMVGDPFPFNVPFNALMVDTAEGRMSINTAVDRGFLLPTIYTFDSANGYTMRSLPDGEMVAWNGHWLGVLTTSSISLVVPPIQSGRNAVTRSVTLPSDGWKLKLALNCAELHDTNNIIGQSTRAIDGLDRQDIVKPPLITPYVNLAVRHDDWGGRSGLYAQDIRSGNGTQSWTLVAGSDQADKSMNISWSGMSLPRNIKLRIKDETSGQVTDMRSCNSISFNSGPYAAERRFSITASPTTGNVNRISNVMATSGGSRASAITQISFTTSSDAQCEVKILNASGSVIGTIANRAVSAGDVKVVWNGRDGAGRSVPIGMYFAQIRSVGSDGDVVKAIQPFAVVK